MISHFCPTELAPARHGGCRSCVLLPLTIFCKLVEEKFLKSNFGRRQVVISSYKEEGIYMENFSFVYRGVDNVILMDSVQPNFVVEKSNMIRSI